MEYRHWAIRWTRLGPFHKPTQWSPLWEAAFHRTCSFYYKQKQTYQNAIEQLVQGQITTKNPKWSLDQEIL